MLPRRLAMLRKLFAMPCERRLVVAYGKSDWPDFKKLFDTAWDTAGKFEWGRVGKTAVVLAPHFATSAFNTNEDLATFAATVELALRGAARPA
jgi:hypothetical protein